MSLQDAVAAYQLVGAAFRTGITPREKINPTQWADSRRVFRPYRGAPKQRFKTRPYAAIIQNTRYEIGVRHIAWMSCEQASKTETMLCLLGHAIDVEHGPVLVVYPTNDLSKDANKKRISPFIRATPSLQARLTKSKHSTTSREIIFEHMSVTLAGSEADSGLETYPQRLRIVDELDRCRPGTLAKIDGRGVTFSAEGELTFTVSTPEDEGAGIHHEYKQGDQREFWVPCPVCKVFHRREWDQVEWPGMHAGKPRPANEIYREACMRCPNPECRKPIYAHNNAQQLLRGIWAPAGLSPVPAAANWALKLQEDPAVWHPRWIKELRERELLIGTPTVTIAGDAGPDSGGDRASYFYEGLLNPAHVNPYGRLAVEYVAAGGKPTREWMTKRRGRAWSTGKRVEPNELRAACAAPGKGGYLSGRIPSDIVVVFLTADVQPDRIYWMLTGFSNLGRRVAIIDAGRLDRVKKDKLINLWPIAGRDHEVIDLLSGETLGRRPIDMGWVDSGDEAREVYLSTVPTCFHGWAHAGGKPVGAVICAKGQGSRNRNLSFVVDVKAITKLPLGPGNVVQKTWLMNFDTDRFSQDVADLVSSLAPETIAMGGRGLMTLSLPWDCSDDLLEQLTSEYLVETRKKGAVKYEWKAKGPNHYRDCLKMALAGAWSWGLDRIEVPPSLESPKAPESDARRHHLDDDDDDEGEQGYLDRMLDD